VAKGTGARRTRTQAPPPARPPPRNQGIRLWIGALAVAFGQLALGETGLHGQPLLAAFIALAIASALFAIFFNHFATWVPRLELPRRLQRVARPQAFFGLLCLVVIASWLLDYYARVGAAIVPGGSYQAPQSQGKIFPIIPTHARLRFPIGTSQAQAIGIQENIWSWNTVATESKLEGPSGRMMVKEWIVVLVFLEPTQGSQFYVHSTNVTDRPVPRYNLSHVDPRSATLVFVDELAGFDLDITNVQ
jgi:hypothetical protein